MNSPVVEILKNLLIINKNDITAIYIQIAQQIVHAIQRGYLEIGSSLPGTRLLSKTLNIHRNTAVKIYEELASQGWVDIVPNKGTFVLNPETKKKRITNLKTNQNFIYPSKTGYNFTENIILSTPYEKPSTTFYFNDGQGDIRLFENSHYKRWYTAALNKTSVVNKWEDMLHESNQFFLTQFTNYLNSTRNLRISTKNILSTRNSEMSLYLISKILIKPKDVILVGNLSNFSANMIFQEAGAQIKTIPTDSEGINVDFIRKNFTKNKIRVLYCNPLRHYPTTENLSSERRIALLNLAKEYNFAIIEDTFDFELQYTNFPLQPLISADVYGNVIYIGRLGQILFPALETAFIVAPENFINEAKNYLRMIERQGDFIKEQVIAEMILEGELHRQNKKLKTIYKKRRDCFTALLSSTFKKSIQFEIPTGGLAVFVKFSQHINLLEYSKIIERYNVFIPKHLLYQTKELCGIRLGFGHLTEDEMTIIVKKLKLAFLEITQKNLVE